jgi:hypothetical protein
MPAVEPPDYHNDVITEIAAGTGLGLAEAARRFPPFRAGRPVNPSTVFRWATLGVSRAGGARLRLEAARVGGRWLTSVQAIERFIRAQTPHLGAAAPRRERTQRKRERAADRAGKQLERMGI